VCPSGKLGYATAVVHATLLLALLALFVFFAGRDLRFMDRYTHDQDRIAACCHRLMDTKGSAVSFCEYNALDRPGDSWEAFPPLARA
jgi:hypothetical protein